MCPSVQAKTYELLQLRYFSVCTFLNHMQVKFDYQGHCEFQGKVKVK